MPLELKQVQTCQGLETHVLLKGALVRLSELPEALRKLPAAEVASILVELAKPKLAAVSRN